MPSAYAPPRIEATHAVRDLLEDAGSCQLYGSDAALKEDMRPVPGLESLREMDS